MSKSADTFPAHEYILEEMRERRWTVHDLAQRMRVPVGVASDVMSGAEPLSTAIARRLGQAFGTSATLWENLAKDKAQ